MRLAFITDEVTQDFHQAVSFAKQHRLQGLELRSVNGMPIDRIPARVLRQWKRVLDDEGLSVCCLASTFFKCDLEEGLVAEEIEKLKRLCDAADVLGCQNIRGFSLFTSARGAPTTSELASCFETPVHLLREGGKRLLLEADPSVHTTNHQKLARLLTAIHSAYVRAIYDPGNSLYDPTGEIPFPDGYEAIRPYMAHVHVKDAVQNGGRASCVKIGTGQVAYIPLLRRLRADGYEGWLSMETHYRSNAVLSEEQMRLPGGEAFSTGGAEATAESLSALRAMMEAVGVP